MKKRNCVLYEEPENCGIQENCKYWILEKHECKITTETQRFIDREIRISNAKSAIEI
ncbi:MAG: hypothetical protein NG712_02885 [Omnitrophica bacterium]|nr:hypothetical protein [Candidatus Omnitrophota bacterium]